ncbi:MAG: VCBS repeat-containing protein [Myxococcota bacterium]|nr:VCBS repeat-containing protein [Myxococcota bacterium]
MKALWWAPLVLTGCVDYDLNRGKDDVGASTDTGLPGEDEVPDDVVIPDICEDVNLDSEEVGFTDSCFAGDGTFNPIVEWEVSGGSCMAGPAVGDLDGDGTPEIVYIRTAGLMSTNGDLVALRGDGSGELWRIPAKAGYASPPAMADLDGDGFPEIVVVREYENSMLAEGDYTIAAYSSMGQMIWESVHFTGETFDYATAVGIHDMNHDGDPEIVAGRAIFTSDGVLRGEGLFGRGSYGITNFGDLILSEGSVSAVADLDLDGQEELIVGNAVYDIDGNNIWARPSNDDGMIAVANLDSDPEGEILAITYNTIRAMDTNGAPLWGPTAIPGGNILSTPAVADLDSDGMPEIVVAGGNTLWTLNHDGSVLWDAVVKDETGATGASIFDFEGDGQPEVVYIDEIEMAAYDGATGALKFYSTEHASATMFDYPVIADVDGDDQAEIVVCHDGYRSSLSVYGDQDQSWAPARKVWNQHAYSITNINDDLTVPINAKPGFTDTNTWHSAIATTGVGLVHDVEADILDFCDEECSLGGDAYISVRLFNKSESETVTKSTWIAFYAWEGGTRTLLEAFTLPNPVEPGWSSEGFSVVLEGERVKDADSIEFVVDDDGTGTGQLEECSETNNNGVIAGPFCQ